MNTIFSTNQILGNIREAEENWEVFASAEAAYNCQESKIEITLDAYLRAPLGEPEETRRVEWLPKSNQVVEHAPRSEAIRIAQDVFVSWVKTVRNALPAEEVLAAADAAVKNGIVAPRPPSK